MSTVAERDVALVDLVDRLLGGGVVIFGDITLAAADVDSARTAFKRDPRVRVLFDNGAGDIGPGALQSVWELPFDSWPVSRAVATSIAVQTS